MTSLQIGLAALFTVASLLIIYHHVGYPLLLKFLVSRTKPKSITSDRNYKTQHDDKDLPSVSFVVPAYNEQEWIAEKIRNIACLDYPRDKLRVIILCDGCSDDTASIARMTIQEAICSDTLFEIFDDGVNRGKVARINQAMRMVTSDVTVLSDVSALISVDALLVCAKHFQDENVGVVNGTYTLLQAGSEGEEQYWRYQGLIKCAEADLATSIGSHGAFYSFRSKLFETLDDNTINDDFILPMQIVSKGYEAHYETNVVATELEPTDLTQDFKRRLRISAGNMQQALVLLKLFHPKFRAIAFAFFSGKGLRLLTPYLMLICLGTSLALYEVTLFQWLFWGQVSVYLTGILGVAAPVVLKFKPLQLIHYLLSGHTANLIGGLSYLARKH